MNKQNIKYGETKKNLTAEWSDRALDDDDRYTDDSIFIRVEVPKAEGKKALMAAMYRAYDNWMRERT